MKHASPEQDSPRAIGPALARRQWHPALARRQWYWAIAEILVIFALFALQGAWPVPDVNEAHYLGKAAHFWNPDWIRGDFFLDSADSHKVFYFAFGWLTFWLPLPVVAWTGRLITWLLLAWSWRRLSVAIIPRPGWSILTAALFVLLNERFQMAGEWFIGGVEAKGFAFVLLLLGLEALVANRWNRAWLLFGASAGFHTLVGGWAVVAAGVAWIFLGKKGFTSFPRSGVGTQFPDAPASKEVPTKVTSASCTSDAGASPQCVPTPERGNELETPSTDRPSFVSMLPGLLGGFLLSLPGLLPALALSRNIDAETIRQANVIYVFERLRHHLDIFQFKMEFLFRFAALTLCYLILCRITRKLAGNEPRQEQPPAANGVRRFLRSICNLQFAMTNLQSTPEKMPLLRLQAFVAGALSIALVGILIDMTSLYDRTFAAGLLRFYWFRLADIVLPLGAAFVLTYWIKQQLAAIWGKLALMAAVVLAGYHFAGYIALRIEPAPARCDTNMIAAALAKNGSPSPSNAARLENLAAWQDACRWISENTPADARFFTPRLSQTFKWYARRAEVATWKDVPQDAGALVAWWNRIQDVFASGSPQPEFRWRENASEMEPERLKKLANKYGAEYLIAPVVSPAQGLKEIYRNTGYVVYHIDRG